MSLAYEAGQIYLNKPNLNLDLSRLVDQVGAPFYLYDLDAICERVELFKSRLPGNTQIHYAMKANDHMLILKVFKKMGLGVDVVSGGELERALDAGFLPEDIVFSGVGKTKQEIQVALISEIAQLNVESLPELQRIAQIAEAMGKKARVALRLNPDVNPDTHPYIRTGFRDNKFGIDPDSMSEILEVLASKSQFVELQGITMHIGSQIRETAPFRDAVLKLLPIFKKLKSLGHKLTSFDVGGGVGIDYSNEDPTSDEQLLNEFGEMLNKELAPYVSQIIAEPGRILVGRFGWLFGQVQYAKHTAHKNFLILNTGMNHIMRPALYQAKHRIFPLKFREGEEKYYDVVGPICESTDVLGHDRKLPPVLEEDWLGIADAGAYGAVMQNDYNRHSRAQEYLVFNNKIVDSEGQFFL